MSKIKKVLYVFSGEKAQGAEIVIERLLAHNLEQVEPHLFIAPGVFANKLLEEDKPYNITLIPSLGKLYRSKNNAFKFYSKAISNYFSISYRVYKYIRHNRIKIVHSNTVVPSSYLLPLVIFSRIFLRDIIFLWSDHDISYFAKLDTVLSKLCVRFFHTTLAVSNAVKMKYGNRKSVHVLYNGLDTQSFYKSTLKRNGFRQLYSIPGNAFVIGMPAVVSPRKGQLGLINVVKQLAKSNTDVRLLLAGGYESSTPEYSQVINESIDAGSVIEHIGYITDLPSFYNACDVVVNNSDLNGSEPLGTTIYEAMACETLVIASNTGGTPEIINDGIDGFLFNAESEEDLSNKLQWVIDHQGNMDIISSAARQKVKAKFNITEMVKRYNDILNLNGQQLKCSMANG